MIYYYNLAPRTQPILLQFTEHSEDIDTRLPLHFISGHNVSFL